MCLWAAIQTFADEPAKRSYDVPAGDAAKTLKEFSAQAGAQIAYPSAKVRGVQTNAVKGSLTAREALEQMLAGTDLVVVQNEATGALTVRRKTTPQEKEDEKNALRLDDYDVSGQKVKPFTASMDLPRTIDDAQPYYIFDSKTIEQSGAPDINEFLRQRLTMNTVVEPSMQAPISTSGNVSNINLRGVGSDKTLILVDGRRQPGVVIQSTEGQPDLNGIPMSAIERIEVLPSSASGIYGGSAIGGVVNVILKRDYTGGDLRVSYDRHFDADDPKWTIAMNYGFALEGGRTNVTLSASWSDSKPYLLRDGADIFQANIKSITSRSPNYIYAAGSPWLGSVPNITPNSSADTQLIFKDGTPLGSINTFIPAGTSNSTSAATLKAGLLANAGRWNLDLPMSTQAQTGLLRPISQPVETRAFRAGVRRRMVDWLELSADFLRTENRTDSIRNAIVNFTVSANAPSNPFTRTVFMTVPTADAVPMTTLSQTTSASLAALLKLPANWIGDVDYTWSENYYSYTQSFTNDTSALTADLNSGVLNVFVDTLQFPVNMQKYFAPNVYSGKNILDDLAIRAHGPLPALPWGQPNLTIGLERRVSNSPARTFLIDMPITKADSNETLYYEQKSTIDSGYAELTVPLIKENWQPGLYSLEAQVAGREERYEVNTGTASKQTYFNLVPPFVRYGGVTLNGQPYFSKDDYSSNNFTVGLKYQPVREVTLRASRATAFLPPTPDQLIMNPVPSTNTITVIDRTTGQPTSGVRTLSGGNPNLLPQDAESTNIGAIWEPTWKPLHGLRLNAEYYRIEQFNAISTLTAQQVVDQESLYPGRVTRDSSGRITQVDISSVNLYHRKTEGWDLSADYNVQTPVGRFGLHAVQSIILHLKEQYSQTLPEYDLVNFPSEGGATKYKGNLTLNWDWRQLSVGWTIRYFGSYKQNGAAGGMFSTRFANGGVYSTTVINATGSDTIPSQTYHDLYVSYRFDRRTDGSKARLSDRLLDGLSVQLNVRNIFDTVAPLDPIYNYYLSPYGGGLTGQASYMLTVRKAF